MPLTQDQISHLDSIYGGSQLTPDQIAHLDSIYGTQGNDAGPISASIGGFNDAVPFGRKITSALGAGYAKIAGSDQPYSDLYHQAEADAQTTAEKNPKSNIGGEIAGVANTLPLAIEKTLIGEVPTSGVRGVINDIPQVLSKVGDFAGRSEIAGSGALANAGNAIIRSAKGAALAAPTGALYGAGNAPTGQELQGAQSGAELGAAIGGALPVAGAALSGVADIGKNLYKGLKAPGIEGIEQQGQNLYNAASSSYQKMKDAGVGFKPEAVDTMAQTVNSALNADGPLNQGLHGKTISVLSDLKNASQQPDFDLEKMDQYRRLLGKIAYNKTPDNLEDARKASIVIDSLDHAVNNLSPDDLTGGGKAGIDALNAARSQYSTASKYDKISDIIQQSGGNANKLKSNLQKLANNPKKTAGFSPSEMMALQQAAKNTTGEGLLKMAGKFGIDLGSSLSVGNTALPALTGAGSLMAEHGDPTIGGAIVGAGTAARMGQKLVARGKAQNLLDMISAGQKVTPQDIGNLSPAEAHKFLEAVKNATTKIPMIEVTKENQ